MSQNFEVGDKNHIINFLRDQTHLNTQEADGRNRFSHLHTVAALHSAIC